MASAKSTKQKDAGTSGKAKKETAPKKDQPFDWLPGNLAQTVLNQFVEAQKTYLKNASQQNVLLIETVNKLSETRKHAPTEPLSDWVKQAVDNYVEVQKRWLNMAF